MPAHLRLADTPTSTPRARQPIRLVLADAHEEMRRSLQLLLDGDGDFEVVAESTDLTAVERRLQRLLADVLVLNVDSHGGSSIQDLRRLRAHAPDTQVVVLTMDDDPALARGVLAAGAIGFVLKEMADSDLPNAIRCAAAGRRFVSPRLLARRPSFESSLEQDELTPREIEVLSLIALGHTSAEIAVKLEISPRTVETHRAHIHRKMGFASRAELVRYALEHGLLSA